MAAATGASAHEVANGSHPAARTISTWYEGFEKRPGVKKAAYKFVALPPCRSKHSPMLQLVSAAGMARSSSDGAVREVPETTKAFIDRQFSHHTIARRRNISKVHKETVQATRDMDDVEFWGAQGADGFRKYLVAKFGSYLAGWRHMDADCNGRITFGEFTRQCRRMGYHGNLMHLWRELDVNLNGSISLGEIDVDAGRYLGSFKLHLMNKYGDLLTAWQQGLDTNGSGRIDKEEIAKCLQDLELDLNPRKMFDYLRASPQGPGVTLKDFDADAHRRYLAGDVKGHTSGKTNKEFIEDVEGLGKEVPLPETFHDKPTHGGALKWRQELRLAERKAIEDKNQKLTALRLGLDSADSFKKALIKRFGSLVGAWREALDLDGNGRLTFGEYLVAMQRLNMHGDLKNLWKELDSENKGHLLLSDLDPEAHTALTELRRRTSEKHGNMLLGWIREFDRRGLGNVTEDDFVSACQRLGYEGNAKRLFQHMRPEPGRKTLSLRDFDTRAHQCLSRGDFRMISDPDSFYCGRKSPLDMTFQERCSSSFYHKIRRGWTAARTEEFKRACLEANAPDRLIDTPEEFEQLCIRTYGSMINAWRLCLDNDANGRLTFDEFCKACRRIGYAGNLTALWRHYDTDDNQQISLKELDSGTHEMVSTFLDKLGERYGHLDNAWKTGFGKDPHECIEIADLEKACEKLEFGHPAKKLFKALQPYPGRLGLTLWDVDPICTQKRQQGRFAPISSKPKEAWRHYVPSHGELNRRDNETGGGSSPSSPPKRKASVTTVADSPNASKWETVEPEFVPGVCPAATLSDSMRIALRNTYGTTLAAWRISLDANMTGEVNYPMFCRTMQSCNFQSKARELWHEMKKSEDSTKQPPPEQTVTFREIDPDGQRMLDKARGKLVAQFGCLSKAWHAIATAQQRKEAEDAPADADAPPIRAKSRVDATWFAHVCEGEGVGIKGASKLFRHLLAYKSQRSITRQDFEALLIGVPPDERHAAWAAGQENNKPALLPKQLQDAAPAEQAPREKVQKACKELHAHNVGATDLKAFKNMMVVKYSSLFSAWRQAIDIFSKGTVAPLEWASVCRAFGVEKSNPLWEELTSKLEEDKKQCITFKEFDPETSDGFDSLQEILSKAGNGDMRQGWHKVFEMPEPRSKRVGKEKFIKQCQEAGLKGNAAKLFMGLRATWERTYLLGDDVCPHRDPNGQEISHAKWIAKAEKRASKEQRDARKRGTCSKPSRASYTTKEKSGDSAPVPGRTTEQKAHTTEEVQSPSLTTDTSLTPCGSAVDALAAASAGGQLAETLASHLTYGEDDYEDDEPGSPTSETSLSPCSSPVGHLTRAGTQASQLTYEEDGEFEDMGSQTSSPAADGGGDGSADSSDGSAKTLTPAKSYEEDEFEDGVDGAAGGSADAGTSEKSSEEDEFEGSSSAVGAAAAAAVVAPASEESYEDDAFEGTGSAVGAAATAAAASPTSEDSYEDDEFDGTNSAAGTAAAPASEVKAVDPSASEKSYEEDDFEGTSSAVGDAAVASTAVRAADPPQSKSSYEEDEFEGTDSAAGPEATGSLGGASAEAPKPGKDDEDEGFEGSESEVGNAGVASAGGVPVDAPAAENSYEEDEFEGSSSAAGAAKLPSSAVERADASTPEKSYEEDDFEGAESAGGEKAAASEEDGPADAAAYDDDEFQGSGSADDSESEKDGREEKTAFATAHSAEYEDNEFEDDDSKDVAEAQAGAQNSYEDDEFEGAESAGGEDAATSPADGPADAAYDDDEFQDSDGADDSASAKAGAEEKTAFQTEYSAEFEDQDGSEASATPAAGGGEGAGLQSQDTFEEDDFEEDFEDDFEDEA